MRPMALALTELGDLHRTGSFRSAMRSCGLERDSPVDLLQ